MKLFLGYVHHVLMQVLTTSQNLLSALLLEFNQPPVTPKAAHSAHLGEAK
jgi:hypothetical protein